jgi:cell wall-associated NlpC family hydrolase
MHAKANDIVYVANGLVDVPYRHQGRNSAGLDCAGLIVVVGQMLDLMGAEETRNYPRRPDVKKFTEEMLKAGLKQRSGPREHGDILRINTEGWPVHLGIYEVDARGQEWIIHAYQPHKKVTRDALSLITAHSPLSSIWRYPD